MRACQRVSAAHEETEWLCEGSSWESSLHPVYGSLVEARGFRDRQVGEIPLAQSGRPECVHVVYGLEAFSALHGTRRPTRVRDYERIGGVRCFGTRRLGFRRDS